MHTFIPAESKFVYEHICRFELTDIVKHTLKLIKKNFFARIKYPVLVELFLDRPPMK